MSHGNTLYTYMRHFVPNMNYRHAQYEFTFVPFFPFLSFQVFFFLFFFLFLSFFLSSFSFPLLFPFTLPFSFVPVATKKKSDGLGHLLDRLWLFFSGKHTDGAQLGIGLEEGAAAVQGAASEEHVQHQVAVAKGKVKGLAESEKLAADDFGIARVLAILGNELLHVGDDGLAEGLGLEFGLDILLALADLDTGKLEIQRKEKGITEMDMDIK